MDIDCTKLIARARDRTASLDERIEAVSALGDSHCGDAVTAVGDLLCDINTQNDLAVAAGYALVSIGDDAARKRLRDAIVSNDFEIRRRGVSLYYRMGGDDVCSEYLEAFRRDLAQERGYPTRILQDAHGNLRTQIARQMRHVFRQGGANVLLRIMEEEELHAAVRGAAADEMADGLRIAVNDLRTFMQNEVPEIVEDAERTLRALAIDAAPEDVRSGVVELLKSIEN